MYPVVVVQAIRRFLSTRECTSNDVVNRRVLNASVPEEVIPLICQHIPVVILFDIFMYP